MKTGAGKSTKSHSTTVTRSGGFFKAARSPGFFGPVARKASAEPEVQAKLSVSKPGDPLEKEADRTAETVMRMSDEQVQRTAETEAVQRDTETEAPAVQRTAETEAVQRETAADDVQRDTAEAETPAVQRTAEAEVQRDAAPDEPSVQRSEADGEQVQRFGEGAPAGAGAAQSEIQQASTGGEGLPADVRRYMEPRLGADLGDVRIHADEEAHSLSSRLSARAFTYRNHVFFGRDQYEPGTDGGRRLLAHELTHTIQQGATVQRAEAQRSPEVTSSGSPPEVQRLGISDALDYFADKAHHIIGFRMLTLLIGFNPINMRKTDRTAANFLRALIELIPGGYVITQVLDNHGVINEAAEWVGAKVKALGDIGSQIVDGIKRFLNSLRWRDIFDLGGVWNRAKNMILSPIARVISFGKGVAGELLNLVKRAILRPLAAMAQNTRGYDLLKAVLGADPVTGDPVPQTPDALIGGFMKLIGREDVWLNIKQGNAVARAYAWFRGALRGLMALVRSIPRRVVQTLKSLTFKDVITVVGAFGKITGLFLGIAGDFFSWAGRQVLGLLEIVFSVVAPGVMPYITKAKQAFGTIVRDPVRFVGNLVRAGRLGFQQFSRKIGAHLKNSLIKWITGPLGDAGVYIPQSFSLLEIVKLVLSVLGLTWQNIRAKLLKIIPEPVLVVLEKSAAVLVTLVTEGPAAAWEQIKAELAELKDQLIGQVTQMVQMEIVTAAVKKLVSMINPAGAVIQAIIATYNTVMFFVQRAREIGAVVGSFVNSIAAIAAGQVQAAANRVETTMAGTLTLVISFLAKLAGFGNIPQKLVGIVNKVRQPIDKGLDKIVAWLGQILEKLAAGVKKLTDWWKKKVPIEAGGESHTLMFEGQGESAKLVVRSSPADPVAFMRDFAKRAPEGQDTESGIATTKAKLEGIKTIQGNLTEHERTPEGAASSGSAETVVGLSAKLDAALAELAGHIAATLKEWGVQDDDPVINGLVFSRDTVNLSWTDAQKADLANQHREMDSANESHLVEDAKGNKVNLNEGLARRHVVSVGNMGAHYGEALNDKKASETKLLIEERSSIPEARVPVKEPLGLDTVKAAAVKRFRGFFGYLKNLFIGGSKENSSIREHLDTAHPMMDSAQKVQDHIEHMSRAWAFDNTLHTKITRKSQVVKKRTRSKSQAMKTK